MIYSTLECLELRAKEGELGAKWEGERKKICTEETHIPKEEYISSVCVHPMQIYKEARLQ